jgi:hypothetical protein
MIRFTNIHTCRSFSTHTHTHAYIFMIIYAHTSGCIHHLFAPRHTHVKKNTYKYTPIRITALLSRTHAVPTRPHTRAALWLDRLIETRQSRTYPTLQELRLLKSRPFAKTHKWKVRRAWTGWRRSRRRTQCDPAAAQQRGCCERSAVSQTRVAGCLAIYREAGRAENDGHGEFEAVETKLVVCTSPLPHISVPCITFSICTYRPRRISSHGRLPKPTSVARRREGVVACGGVDEDGVGSCRLERCIRNENHQQKKKK